MQVGPLVDLPRLTQPLLDGTHSKAHDFEKERGKLVCESETHGQSETPLHLRFSGRCLHTERRQGSVAGDQFDEGKTLCIRGGGGQGVGGITPAPKKKSTSGQPLPPLPPRRGVRHG